MKLQQESVLQSFDEETHLKLKEKALQAPAQYTALFEKQISFLRLH